MIAFNKFFTTVFLAIAYANVASAAPWPSNEKHATHRLRQVARDLQIETFHPLSTFEVNSFLDLSYLIPDLSGITLDFRLWN